jgi:Pyruvate/2-oxoacid:ferredoxin oxidoreductase delta subunit
MELDSSGYPQPTGKFDTIAADCVVLALGQEANYKFLEGLDGLQFIDSVLQVDDQMMTGHRGVFAGGDMVPSERTVTVAAGHGKKAARCINAFLRGEVYKPPQKNPVASFDKLNPWYYSDAPKTVQPVLDAVRRQTTFAEVQGGLDETNALFEARRCLSCGNCFHCDNCFGMCPDNAVKKMFSDGDVELSFNYEYCKGCGLCAAECPCGSIEMSAEPS